MQQYSSDESGVAFETSEYYLKFVTSRVYKVLKCPDNRSIPCVGWNCGSAFVDDMTKRYKKVAIENRDRLYANYDIHP